ncbi:MAG: 30S ribosomal protein S3 [Candidatus Edwardsbacteria bacterium RIFOXYD12_FULL_50_11]|uniref:Small ribosomal subunit protein uS3 n=1 Tax=Candidatus Edwardsbacteria bacterium GWF2_54_11 TaxID=1817851 RepID=A0A1F5RIM1_9BACT|nr:MAG: 30S ribosomal protein S3 [Candidatus Edwardsbacteria bacterium RifOxyC12_full_54_24]OGF06016.1 MAG: 30S ribosomal protein S3 [Candidatus Edwardsbacteria bacterium RifOxyA12_full_54_48]OGF11825.1 MAG: 30S ribosomal protein S3 [Candidatus Edwardsbacteria bacterium GWE2_54_12]OGF14248.1 MAG: 30S ribosomal protein S3 [Candidatus Edwardsbacteria bacterium GWF2_54_11]OGF16552.1 MAG: 30S ribosomal protein S3 [Candidatus Edwardsbacteria bacterium RIFOXYD12_FULL_50_11]OGJ18256.1 MAG: 30S riboso
MGQKTHPIGLRLGIIKTWDSRWFAKNDFASLLEEDERIRRYLRQKLMNASISKIEIERTSKRVTVTIHTSRPGIVIGRKGGEIEKLKAEIQHLTAQKEVHLNISEIKVPEMDARLVADNIARQLEQRISFRRAMKKAVQSTLRMGAYGIKIACGGRLGGAEIARTESYREGRVPMHTLRADIDYATSTSHTTFGCIGIKVWIFKGEVLGKQAVAK